MSEAIPARAAPPRLIAEPWTNRILTRQMLLLALPVLAEQILHMLVGLTDTYLANHLDVSIARSATAAVGSIAYVLWLIGLLVGAIGTGSTALIARATGARHRSLANSVCGQSVTSAAVFGVILGALLFIFARRIVAMTGLSGEAPQLALAYLRLIALGLPLMMLLFVANACLRGAGDTLTPALVMIIVDALNVIFSFALVRGWWGLPSMGFNGIALGTLIAYSAGGIIQLIVLLSGRGGLRLYAHRLRPHWSTLKRLLRIGIPAGTESLLSWLAQFAIVIVINQLDPTNIMAAAHINTIRLESISFLSGFAFATAAATMVGQSLGMNDPRRATRSAYLAYTAGGGVMTLCGVLFVLLPHYFAGWLAGDTHVADLTARCLFVTGFVQLGFAASMIFSGALRGAGDTFSVMLINLASIIAIRLLPALIVGLWLRMGLVAIWIVLSLELLARGALVYGRFVQGKWKEVRV